MGDEGGEGCDEYGRGCRSHGEMLNQIFRYAHAGKKEIEQRNDDDGSPHPEKAGKEPDHSTAEDEHAENIHRAPLV